VRALNYQHPKVLHIRIFVRTNFFHIEGNATLPIYKQQVYAKPTSIHKNESLKSIIITGKINAKQIR
jgi:hypothetical protein